MDVQCAFEPSVIASTLITKEKQTFAARSSHHVSVYLVTRYVSQILKLTKWEKEGKTEDIFASIPKKQKEQQKTTIVILL